jgi:hypothetical protein
MVAYPSMLHALEVDTQVARCDTCDTRAFRLRKLSDSEVAALHKEQGCADYLRHFGRHRPAA